MVFNGGGPAKDRLVAILVQMARRRSRAGVVPERKNGHTHHGLGRGGGGTSPFFAMQSLM